LEFDATRDKDGSRHTDIGVELDALDVITLFQILVDDPDHMDDDELWRMLTTMVRELSRRRRAAKADRKKLDQTLERFQLSMNNIYKKVWDTDDDDPDSEKKVVQEIRKIAGSTLWPNVS
jgi:hypothetical protein